MSENFKNDFIDQSNSQTKETRVNIDQDFVKEQNAELNTIHNEVEDLTVEINNNINIAEETKEQKKEREYVEGETIQIDGNDYLYTGYVDKDTYLPDGYGVIHTQKGSIVYEGNFKNGKYDGYGKEYLFSDYSASLISYKGNWENGEKNGYGTEYSFYHNKAENRDKSYIKYKGNWENGSKNGYGTEYDKDGFFINYEGNWENGDRNGYGKLYSKKGNIYQGTRKDNRLNGEIWRELEEE